MTKTLRDAKLPAGLRRKDVTKFWVDCDQRDRWCVLKSIGDGEPVMVTPRYASAVNAWAQLIGRERALSMDEATARKLLFRSDIGTGTDLRRTKPQAKIPGSTKPGRRGVGRDRAKPDTSTYEGRFAARLGELAKEQGFEPADLAQRLGVSDQVVYDWLAGRKMPAVGRFPALAKLLKCKHPGDILPPK